ncbi:MAG: hypothetical protein JOY94_03410 [Methylobacteriaceae bacterium]|nr:hypothetical protein [Methylobacteriaceae bacterium]
MTVLSLREAAQEAGTSKSTILRAIQSGRLSAPRNHDGGYDIDPAELFRVYPPKPKTEHSAGGAAGQDGAANGAAAAELATKLAALEVEIRGLKDLLAEVKQSRDEWRDQASRLTNAIPDLRATKPLAETASERSDERIAEAADVALAIRNPQPKRSWRSWFALPLTARAA